MEELYLQCGAVQCCKEGETLCGDFYTSVSGKNGRTVVLSDGLGSGVKANILATLTAKILSTLTNGGLSEEECVDTVAMTLPVCKVRRLAYATFTIARFERGNRLELSQFDNPAAILLRNGKNFDYPSSSRTVNGKEIFHSTLELCEEDTLVLFSDGVSAAGLGKTTQNGWGREEIVRFLERWYEPSLSAQQLAALVARACLDLYLSSPDDDCTVLVYRLRPRRAAQMLIGPPENKNDDDRIFRLFFAKEGYHIVCGGTTARTVSAYLNKPVEIDRASMSENIPAKARIEGVDLVTEGVITLRALVELGERYRQEPQLCLSFKEEKNAVGALAELLFEQVSDIHIYFGQAVNPAHADSDAGISFQSKLAAVKALEEMLEKMGKRVTLSLC